MISFTISNWEHLLSIKDITDEVLLYDMKTLLKNEFSKKFPQEDGKISIVFVDKDKITELNTEFRDKNMATDVLAFNFEEGEVIGEVYVCPDYLMEVLPKEISFSEEVFRMIVHGSLHVLGFDHKEYFGYSESAIGEGGSIPNAEKMFQIQERIVSELGDSSSN